MIAACARLSRGCCRRRASPHSLPATSPWGWSDLPILEDLAYAYAYPVDAPITIVRGRRERGHLRVHVRGVPGLPRRPHLEHAGDPIARGAEFVDVGQHDRRDLPPVSGFRLGQLGH